MLSNRGECMYGYIVVGSVTYALKGKNHLAKQGIYAQVAKTPKEYNKRGCSYSVMVYREDLQIAQKLLADIHIGIQDIVV